MKVTQHDIAKALKITRTTVARALNNSGPVNPELKQQIIVTAKKMGYKVNYQAKTLSMQREVVIWVFLSSFYNKYFLQEVCLGVEKAQEELKESKLRVNVHINVSIKVEEQVEEMQSIIDTENPDGVIMIPLTDAAIQPIYDKCIQRNIRIVTLDMDTKIIRPTFHIGPDYYAGGRLAAGLMKRMTKREGKILLIKPHTVFDTLELRSKGFVDTISEIEDLELLEVEMDIETEKIYDITLRELKNNKDIVGIYSTIKVDGIPEALETCGSSNEIVVVANDLSPYVATYIKKGVIDACIYFRPFMQGYMSVETLFHGIIMNEKKFDDIETYFEVVILENLENYTKRGNNMVRI